MSSTMTLKASDSFLIAMHQVCSATASVNQINLHKISDTTRQLATASPITIPTVMKTRSTSQDRNVPHMSSTMTLKASVTFLIAMHQICSAGESEKSLQRPVLINLHKISDTTSWLATASPITIPTLMKTRSTSQNELVQLIRSKQTIHSQITSMWLSWH